MRTLDFGTSSYLELERLRLDISTSSDKNNRARRLELADLLLLITNISPVQWGLMSSAHHLSRVIHKDETTKEETVQFVNVPWTEKLLTALKVAKQQTELFSPKRPYEGMHPSLIRVDS
jgi:hypothetical protein